MVVDDYLDGVPEPQRTTLRRIRDSLRSLLPGASEQLSYGVPAFAVEGKAVAGYASFRNHCSFYPHSGSVLPALAEELIGYDWSQGTLRFPVDRPLPESLIARLVEARLEQLGLEEYLADGSDDEPEADRG